MTVLHVERHLVDTARRDAHETAVCVLLDAMRLAPGFLWADAGRSFSDPELVTIASEWRTDADLDRFRGGGDYARFAEAVDVCLREDASLRRYAAVLPAEDA